MREAEAGKHEIPTGFRSFVLERERQRRLAKISACGRSRDGGYRAIAAIRRYFLRRPRRCVQWSVRDFEGQAKQERTSHLEWFVRDPTPRPCGFSVREHLAASIAGGGAEVSAEV